MCPPFPLQGHITPLLSVANLLHARGFQVTFVNSEYIHARLFRTRGAAAMAGSSAFRFATIPDGLPQPSDNLMMTCRLLCLLCLWDSVCSEDRVARISTGMEV